MNNILRAAAALVILLFLCGTGLYAMGRADDTEPEAVNGLENWDHSIDTSELPPGEYNIIVRGTDRAGNVGIGGPYNVFIDPSIQIPRVSISTPSEGGSTGNLVNVVGTAADDEGVVRVEIAVDDGNFQSVDGTEFWTVTLDSSAWEDGVHVLTARAWDRDNNESPHTSVSFYKDTIKPLIRIESHENGSYISGKIEFLGTITDLNGVDGASFSIDGGRTFEELKLSRSKEQGGWKFKRRIDTRDFEDGAHVYWIEAVDELGSVSRQPFLFYIDNSPPELALISPAEDDAVNGNITLIGTAVDAVGLTRLAYEADNGAEGEVALSAGNPVWVLPLDYTGFRGKEARVKMDLVDLVGNHETAQFKIPLDKDGDLPVPGLSADSASEFSSRTPVVTGLMADDDGSAGKIAWSLNGGELQSLDVDGPWKIILDDAVYGENSLVLTAVDKNGTAGEKTEHNFVYAAPAPVLLLDSWYPAEEALQWFPGVVVDAKNPGVISGRLAGYYQSGKLSWSINGGELNTVTLKSGENELEKHFDVKLPRNLDSGRIEFEIFGTASDGSEFSASTVYYNYLAPKVGEGEEVPEFRIPDSGGLHLILPDTEAGGIRLENGVFISGWTPDGDISSVELSAGSEFLTAEVSGNAFRLYASEEGTAELSLSVKLKNGREFVSDRITIVSDSTPPRLSVSGVKSGGIVGAGLEIPFSVEDNTGGSKLYYSVDGGESFKQVVQDETADGILGIELPEGDEAFIDFVLKAEDDFGNSVFEYYPLLKDVAAPEIEFITADFERGAEQITWSGRISDGDSVDSLTVSFLPPPVEPEEGAEEPAVESGASPREYAAEVNEGFFYLDVNLTGLGFEPGEVEFTAVDRAGNVNSGRRSLDIDLNEGKPLVGIQVPVEDDAFETGFSLSGLILDKEGVESVSYSLNGGPFTEAGGGNIFTVPLALEQMLDNQNVVSVKAVDVNGLESEVVSRNFRISFDPPEAGVDYPDLESVVKGVIRLEGHSSDVNGIEAVFVSHDNGTTFQRADGTEEWTYMLDTRLFSDGVSSLLVKAVDKAGVAGYFTTLVNVDNREPLLSVSHPADGAEVMGSLTVNGRVVDNTGIKSLNVYIAPLEPGEDSSPETVTPLMARGTILEDLDLSGYAPGAYSFRVEAVDSADNISTASRVIKILPDRIRPPVMLSPLPGERLGPRFAVEGYLPDSFSKVLLLVDGEIFDTVDADTAGRFRYDITPEHNFPEGGSELSLRIEAAGEAAENVAAPVEYSRTGLYVGFDNLSQEQYVGDRFVIVGRAAYETDLEDPKEVKKLQPSRVRLSLDGGRTYEQLNVKDGVWDFTMYREEVPDGEYHLLVQTSVNDETAFARCRITMDTKIPEVGLFSPDENSKLFGDIDISGEASDEDGLTDVTLSFREGDKDNYQTPSFIQGMYFDASGLGATYFTAGLGLTFMDDNVKLQMQYGYAPTTMTDPDTGLERAARFGGNVFGAKLLANLAQIPFSWLFGPEWSAFSATAALGANFSYFSANAVESDDSWGVILAGVVAQAELPKVEFEDREFLKYVSLYWEGQLWLISSDVSPEVTLLPSIGVRLGLF